MTAFTTVQLEYAAHECVRQQTGPEQVGYMLDAIRYASLGTIYSSRPFIGDAVHIAELVEPDVNTFGRFRRTPVTFRSGGHACNWHSVPDATKRLFDALPDHPINGVDDWCKALLDIHPWADGNGRTVSILRNWILGTLDYPTALPYYYEENP